MKNTRRLPTGAPKRVLRFFSSFDSIRNCVSAAEVCAEKFTVWSSTPLRSRNSSSAATVMTDLPTPVTPDNSTDRPTATLSSSRREKRTVSTVGTSIWKNGSCRSYEKLGTRSVHARNSCGKHRELSTTYSKTVPPAGNGHTCTSCSRANSSNASWCSAVRFPPSAHTYENANTRAAAINCSSADAASPWRKPRDGSSSDCAIQARLAVRLFSTAGMYWRPCFVSQDSPASTCSSMSLRDTKGHTQGARHEVRLWECAGGAE
eukprot:359090-Chlamydomonas_euryale.AAC.3